MVRSDDMCFEEDGIFGRGMRRDRLETALWSKKKTHVEAMTWADGKIALLEDISVRAMSSEDRQVRF